MAIMMFKDCSGDIKANSLECSSVGFIDGHCKGAVGSSWIMSSLCRYGVQSLKDEPATIAQKMMFNIHVTQEHVDAIDFHV